MSQRVIYSAFLVLALAVVCASAPRGAAAQAATSNGALTGVSRDLPNMNSGLRGIVETAGIEIYLKDASGAPIPSGAVITLMKLDGLIYRKETAGKGKNDYVRFNDVAPTEYSVQVVVPGYAPVVQRVDTHDKVTSKLTVNLKPLSAEEAALAAQVAKLAPKAQKELGKAVAALRDNETGKARGHLDALMRTAPNHAEVNYLYGVYASKTSDQAHAVSYWMKAVAADPQHVRALLSLSDALLREKKSDEAVLYATRAANADPSSWRAHAVLASAYSQKNAIDEALQQAERALELGHAQADMVQPLLAGLLARRGNHDRALEIMQAYAANHPKDEAAKKDLEVLQRTPAAFSTNGETESAAAAAATAMPLPSNWLPPDVDEKLPPVEPGQACALADVVSGAGNRMREFVDSLDRFTATEFVKHQTIDRWGGPSATETRRFDYLASIQEVKAGVYNFEEFRNVNGAQGDFPGGVATYGLPAMGMIFHPFYAENFEMACEGLSHWDGKAVWQVHFRQRPDKPNMIRNYRFGPDGSVHPVALKGRAWIAADTLQIVRLETDLVASLPEIRLLADHTIVEYGPVHFKTGNVDMWLPRTAEAYYDWKGRRVHREHSFTNYLLFSVADKQRISLPASTEPAPPPGESHR